MVVERNLKFHIRIWMKGPRQSQNVLPVSIIPPSNQQLFGSKLHFCGSSAVRRRYGLERKDQQDDDEHRAGEEADGGPLAAV